MTRTGKREWFHEFFDGLYGRVLGGRAHEKRAPREAALIKRVLHLRRGRRVLDCPCGLGRIARELARLGLDVTGVDLTAGYIRRARRRAARRRLAVRFIQGDMRELAFEKEFDAVVNWFSSFGYCDDDGNLAAARAAYRALRPGGRFLIEVIHKTWMLGHWRPDTEEVHAGVRIRSQAWWNGRTGRVNNVWTLTCGAVRERRAFSLRVYSAPELRRLLRQAGFRDVRVIGRPSLGRVTRHARRIIAIARRPG